MGAKEITFPGTKTAEEIRNEKSIAVYRYMAEAEQSGMKRLDAAHRAMQKYDIKAISTIYTYIRKGAELLGHQLRIDRRYDNARY